MASPFWPAAPNPFRWNAFTITGVSVDDLGHRLISDRVRARREEIEYYDVQHEVPIGKATHRVVRLADLTASEKVLHSPSDRSREELLMPADRWVASNPAVAAFLGANGLRAEDVDRLVECYRRSIDCSPLLGRWLPELEVRAFAQVSPSTGKEPGPWIPLRARFLFPGSRQEEL